MFRTFIAAAAAIVLLGAPSANADIFELVGSMEDSTEGLANFSATLDYIAAGDGLTGIRTVSITNTTDAATGGWLTGFLFNHVSSDPAATVALLAGSTHDLKFASGNGQPFGMAFKAGAAVGGNWQGDGNPNRGVAVGDTGVFSFLVTASDAGALSAAGFADGPYAFKFVVRFRGLGSGGSDKVPGVPAGDPPPELCPCDFNGDGVVDETDLDLLLAAWNLCLASPHCEDEPIGLYDLSGDGIITNGDLRIFLLCWIECEGKA